ncbi:hypothetical protein [Hoeflea sp.]|uniref:hypothetical protein n=1 Tax=Hoeflea sp. TaxID=1940281 RepID=UPI003B52524C
MGAVQLVGEVFHRSFKNRKHLASYLGLAPERLWQWRSFQRPGYQQSGKQAGLCHAC